ncbi:hypothetical protein [Pseudoalteromonas luteoviolacea]|uniref:Baseplate protein J-like domain-containing protein n=1 Tax=Pseudoalteromonas luteoviolacea DSM 6061 TaxID=1365250 RepID=A0A166VBH6_9GAMM|nr:hypothetical protein [Pseudoalteromonas luteoviolacea]KZN32453.1 hypothetical protein N475_22495 [Pseudoalteromonas luteoviolacea DSM 6061]MBE0386031.1 hypothetical protein [Pseudoalteromonas luteoviolacea DSM 6061]
MTSKSRSLSQITHRQTGLSQTGRTIPELSSGFYKIEPRSIEHWLSYLGEVAKNTHFIGTDSWRPVQSWYKVLPEADKFVALSELVLSGKADEVIRKIAARPDLALLLTFIDLLAHSQNQFNDFIERHLNYYYQDVLGFEPLAAEPDAAHVLITLNDVESMTLQPGTEFDGGKDELGNDLTYLSTEPCAINRAVVDNVTTVNKLKTSSGLDICRHILSDTEQGVELDVSAMTFGDGQQSSLDAEVEIGFKVASQDLFLSSGKRIISLRFSSDEFGESPLDLTAWPESFDVWASTEDGPVLLTAEQVSLNKEKSEIIITVDELFSPITPVPDIFIGNDKALPYLSFVLKKSKYQALYGIDLEKREKLLETLTLNEIQEVRISTLVIGANGLIGNNGTGFLDMAKPFEPFGFSPQLAEKFEFTHPELLCKRVARASIELNWVGRPDDFDAYYKTYLNYQNAITPAAEKKENSDTLTWPKNQVLISQSDQNYNELNHKIQADLFYNDDLWEMDIDPEVELAVSQSKSLPANENNISTNRLSFTFDDDNGERDYLTLPFNLTQAKEWPKWYTFELSNQDFGHPYYLKVAEYYAYQNSINLTKWDPDNGDFIPTQVPEPYTPLLDSVKLNYYSESISRAQRAAIGNSIWIEHISPIGRQLQLLEGQNNLHLLPQIDDLGYLYIALGSLVTPGQCSVLFQLEAVDGYNFAQRPDFKWEYYNQGKWHHFSREDSQGTGGEGRILQDNTYDLLDSGIIIFSLPEFDESDQFNQDGKVWIRAAIDSSVLSSDYTHPIYSRLKGVFSQAVKVTLGSKGHPESHYIKPLPAESIASLVITDPLIASVEQPFDSFGARVTEDQSRLYRRVSERLRHRDRLLTGWDFEHHTLQTFPELHTARAYKTSDGVNMMVIPLNHDSELLQPKVPRYLMRQIQDEVELRSVPNLDITVVDPIYVEVQLEIIIQIDPRFDIQTTVIELNELIVDTLTPWNKSDEQLSHTIYLADVAQALEMHQAVKMVQVIRGKRLDDNIRQYAQVSPKTMDEILVPSRNHKISLTNVAGDVFEGIGKWKIQHNFVVQ